MDSTRSQLPLKFDNLAPNFRSVILRVSIISTLFLRSSRVVSGQNYGNKVDIKTNSDFMNDFEPYFLCLSLGGSLFWGKITPNYLIIKWPLHFM